MECEIDYEERYKLRHQIGLEPAMKKGSLKKECHKTTQ
jgi:hypothetical protein